MYRRWRSTYTVKWTPILTFNRRHLLLLEWFEKNLDPVAFTDQNGKVGVALISEDLRVTVSRSEMVLETGLSGLEIEKLLVAVTGIIDVMEPKDIVLSSARSMSTVEVAGVDYAEACANFGAKLSAPPLIKGGFRPTDGSALVDLHSDSVRFQIEWGIVRPNELLMRLTKPMVSRIDSDVTSGSIRVSLSRAQTLVGDQLPPVSVWVETSARRKTGGEAHDAESIGAACANLDDLTKDVSESLAAEFVKGLGTDQ